MLETLATGTAFNFTEDKKFTEEESSALDYIAYDVDTDTMAVRWRNSNVVYVYSSVDKSDYDSIVDAYSPGNVASRLLSKITSTNGKQPDRYDGMSIVFVQRSRPVTASADDSPKYEVLMHVSGTVRLTVGADTIGDAIDKIQNEIINHMYENSEVDILKVERVFE